MNQKEYDKAVRTYYAHIKRNPELYKKDIEEIDPDLPFGFGAYQLACRYANGDAKFSKERKKNVGTIL